MTLLAPFEDFVLRTLGTLPALWSKLDYVAGLRQPDGTYAHWGLERTHGQAAAREVMPRAHRELFLEVLRTPLARLDADAERAASELERELADYLKLLAARGAVLLPGNDGGGSAEHFTLVLDALSTLAQARLRANRPAA